MAHEMRMKDSRICCVCDEAIPTHQPYRVGLLGTDAAGELLESIYCLGCTWSMKGTDDLDIRYDS